MALDHLLEVGQQQQQQPQPQLILGTLMLQVINQLLQCHFLHLVLQQQQHQLNQVFWIYLSYYDKYIKC